MQTTRRRTKQRQHAPSKRKKGKERRRGSQNEANDENEKPATTKEFQSIYDRVVVSRTRKLREREKSNEKFCFM